MPTVLLLRCALASILILSQACAIHEVVKDEEARLTFKPELASVEVRFSVVDRRPFEDRQFRIQPLYGTDSFFYGDGQFFPGRLRALETRFAERFPDATDSTSLVVERFDVAHQVVRGRNPVQAGGGCAELYSCLLGGLAMSAYAAVDSANPDSNLVVVRLSGTFDGVAFDAEDHDSYVHYGSRLQTHRVAALLDRTIGQAVDAVRSAKRSSAATVKPLDAPRLQLPRLYTVPRDADPPSNSNATANSKPSITLPKGADPDMYQGNRDRRCTSAPCLGK
jgi:hypothetical protein